VRTGPGSGSVGVGTAGLAGPQAVITNESVKITAPQMMIFLFISIQSPALAKVCPKRRQMFLSFTLLEKSVINNMRRRANRRNHTTGQPCRQIF
jgi:hypothetical protein